MKTASLKNILSRIKQASDDYFRKTGYPNPLTMEVLNRMNIHAFPDAREPKITFSVDNNIMWSHSRWSMLKHLVLFSRKPDFESEKFIRFLPVGKNIMFLVESCNKETVLFVRRLPIVQTEYCQRKLIASVSVIRAAEPKKRFPIVVRNFKRGSDEKKYCDFYNSVLGFLGTKIDVSFVRKITARPSFDPAGYFIAEENGRYVGFLAVEKEPWGRKGSGFGYIYQIGVDTRYLGKGLAGILLKKAVYFARSHRLKSLGVGINGSNHAAAGFFKKSGFSEAFRIDGCALKRMN